MGKRVFGPQELKLPGEGYTLSDREGRLLASGGCEELKAFLACNGRDHAHSHLLDGQYHLRGPDVDDTYHKHEGEVYRGGGECFIRSVALKIGEEPDPCCGPPVRPFRVLNPGGTEETQFVCAGHVEAVNQLHRHKPRVGDN
jgi:hypothetical protein